MSPPDDTFNIINLVYKKLKKQLPKQKKSRSLTVTAGHRNTEIRRKNYGRDIQAMKMRP